MKDKKIEDICIILDSTSNFYGNHWIMVETSSGIVQLVQSKISQEPGSRFALISFSDRSKIELNFDEFSLENFINALNCIELSDSKAANIYEGMKLAYELTEKNMKNLIEGKKFRIIIISAGIFKETNNKWKDLLEIFVSVGIVIDTIQLSKSWDPKSTILERLANETRGNFYNSEDVYEIEELLTNLALLKEADDENRSLVDEELKVLEIIVEDLISINNNPQLFKDLSISMEKSDEDMKCGICHSQNCVVCGNSALNCASFCPECHRFFHQHCCGGWAKSQKSTPRTYFKCPACYHLLRIPESFIRTIE